MRGVKEYEGRHADGGRREKESDHGGPWIMRLSAVLLDLLLSNRKLESLAGGASFSRRRRSSTSRQPEEEERRGKQGAGPHEHAGPSRPNVSLPLSPIVHHVDVELGPTQRGLEGHGRSAYPPLCPPGSRWTSSPCCQGFPTCGHRFSSSSALVTCRLSPPLLGGSRQLVSARLVLALRVLGARRVLVARRRPGCRASARQRADAVYPDFRPNVTGERIHPTVSLPCSNPLLAYSIASRLLYSFGTKSEV
jgi:hypothetical protein